MTLERARKELPVKKPDEPVPFWKIISKFIGQDMTRVSMPVIMNEPMSGLQRFAESLIDEEEAFRIAAKTDDPVKRLMRVCIAFVSMLSSTKMRKRKPFNPMLGETYELVTDKFRFLAEKTGHLPVQTSACIMEGEGYTLSGSNSVNKP